MAELSEIDEGVEKKRRVTQADFDAIAEFVIEEHQRRKSKRKDREADWNGLLRFYHEVFFPYLIGGLIPGVICATIAYYLSVSVIRAYQNRRRKRIKAKFRAIKKKAASQADALRDAK